jgi:mRNA-degrading endonuclease RelE of RelBE toxin-antitoxin system
MYRVEFTSKRVQKELKALTKVDQKLVNQAIEQLKLNPKPLDMDFGCLNRDKDVKRIKVGRVRLLYTISEPEQMIWLGRLEYRDGATYKQDPKEWFRRSA